MLTLGVDLASQPKHTAACLIRWAGDRASVDELVHDLTDTDLHRLFAGADKVGIDAPFGWPSRFVEAVTAYAHAATWPVSPISELRFRRTDRVVHLTTGRWPLSVSSDLIAVPAFRAARLLAEVEDGGEAIDRSGKGRFVESYPAAALAIWGFRSTGYKRATGAAVRHELLAELTKRTRDWLELTDEHKSRCEGSDDAFDSVIASLIARAAAVGLCERIALEDLELARQEGWIALPTSGSLDRLFSVEG